MSYVLKTENVIKNFSNQERVLNGITLAIEEGSFTVMLGPSGSGKSTLLNVMSGLLKPTMGTVWYGEREVSAMKENQLADWKRTETGTIFQNYLLLNNLNVKENIEIGISPHSKPIDFEKLTRILEIEHLLSKFPAQLSGGEQQRVSIARAVIKNPRILFCDEATGALDEANSKKVVGLLHSLRTEFLITILFVTHNLQIAETAERVITIKDGKVSSDRQNAHPIAAELMVWE